MADNVSRRDFLGMSLGGVAAIGAGASLYAMKASWDPLPSVISAGFTVVDLTPLDKGEVRTVNWRGKPVYVLKKTDDMKKCPKRDVIVGSDSYSVGIQICTHLGCIPSYSAAEQLFKCACHGGEFDACGVQSFGPPPTPMEIPPFKIDGNTLVLGEEGPEYQNLIAQA